MTRAQGRPNHTAPPSKDWDLALAKLRRQVDFDHTSALHAISPSGKRAGAADCSPLYLVPTVGGLRGSRSAPGPVLGVVASDAGRPTPGGGVAGVSALSAEGSHRSSAGTVHLPSIATTSGRAGWLQGEPSTARRACDGSDSGNSVNTDELIGERDTVDPHGDYQRLRVQHRRATRASAPGNTGHGGAGITSTHHRVGGGRSGAGQNGVGRDWVGRASPTRAWANNTTSSSRATATAAGACSRSITGNGKIVYQNFEEVRADNMSMLDALFHEFKAQDRPPLVPRPRGGSRGPEAVSAAWALGPAVPSPALRLAPMGAGVRADAGAAGQDAAEGRGG